MDGFGVVNKLLSCVFFTQEKATIEECKKLEYLSRHIPIFKSGSAKRNMNDGNRDGRRQRKRR